MWLRRSWNAKVMEAICLGDCERLRDLHRQGIRMDARSSAGESYLHRVAAIRLGWASQVAETLLELGAEVNSTTASHFRPLHTAVISGNLDVIEVLLNHGADIDAQTEHGFTALHYAVSNDELEIVKRLLNHGANARLATAVGYTPLAIAQRNEAWEIADLLWDSQFRPRAVRGNQTRFQMPPTFETCTVH